MNVFDIDYYQRLREDYLKHGSLFVAFDYDNTVYDYHGKGIDYSDIINLLIECNKLGFKLILFSANRGHKLVSALENIDSMGIEVDYVNENPTMNTGKKPYFNILLDDRAGLKESYKYLKQLIDEIRDKKI